MKKQIFLLAVVIFFIFKGAASVEASNRLEKLSSDLMLIMEQESNEKVSVMITVETPDIKKIEEQLQLNGFTGKQYYEMKREMVRKEQTEINNSALATLSSEVNFELEYMSSFLPSIQILVKSKDIDELLNNPSILYIERPIDPSDVISTPPGGGCVTNCFEDPGDTGGDDSISLEQFTEFGIYDVRASHQVTGTNIKVGILELGTFDYTHQYLDGKFAYVEYNTGYDNTEPYDIHATAVALVIGGDYGVAPNASLYGETLSNYTSDLDNLILKGVDIINISFVIDYCDGDYYHNTFSSLTDYVVSELGIVIVAAAGNNDSYYKCPTSGNSPGDMIGYPQLSHNIITVGSVQSDGDTVFLGDLSFIEPSGFVAKPTLLAPGGGDGMTYDPNTQTYSRTTEELLYIPGSEYSNEETAGTSFAAPFVSGVIAMMMQKDSDLMNNPSAVASILTASCDDTEFQDVYSNDPDSPGYSEAFGAGKINVVDVFEIIVNNQYITYEFISQTSLQEQWFDIFTVSELTYMKMSHTYIYYQDFYNPTSDFPTINSKIFEGTSQKSLLGQTTNWGLFEKYYSAVGNYRVKITLLDPGDLNFPDKGSFAWCDKTPS